MKRKNILLVSLVVLVIISLIHFACNGEEKILNVPLYAQQTSMWCWAGSGEMIMTFLGGHVAQCTQANSRFGRSDCCNTPTPAACVQGGWPEYNKWGFAFSSTPWGTALTWAQLKGQIDINKPIGFSWGWTGGGGHYMVAKGYTTSGGVNQVAVNDPWPWNPNKFNGGTSKIITYSEYVSSSSHVHWKDDYNITVL
jgi:hypothetical protein